MAHKTIKIDFQNQDSGKQTQNSGNNEEANAQIQKECQEPPHPIPLFMTMLSAL